MILRRVRALTRQPERGSEALEAAVGVPAFLLFIALIIFAGRVAIAHQAVEAAAADAARSASIARTQGSATSSGSSAATASLANQKLQCSSKKVSVDTSGFASPVGTPAKITVAVTCVVNISDLALPGIPGQLTVKSSMSSPIDTYRER
ncbi:MAG: pilus assembly protein [Tomitella sp.]|nr:pilus assembly protein [Tomitella sp.]